MNDSFTHDEMYPRKAFLPVSFVRGALSCETPQTTNNFPCIAAAALAALAFITRAAMHNQQFYLFPPQTTAGSMYSGHSRRGRYPDCNRSSYIRSHHKEERQPEFYAILFLSVLPYPSRQAFQICHPFRTGRHIIW